MTREPEYMRIAREHARKSKAGSNGTARRSRPAPEPEPAGMPEPEAPAWRPFPVDALPVPVSNYVEQASLALGADAALIALPLLSALGAAIGNARRIAIRRDWTEPPILWTVAVGESGTLKSPAFDMALDFTRERQRQAFVTHRKLVESWEHHREEEGSNARRPVCERCLAGDTTLEALACRLADAPRGLLLGRDELAGWFRSFDAYRKGRGGDMAHYLTLHRAGDLILDRKTGERETLFVPRAFLAVTGGVQPGVLRRLLTTEFFEAGLPARFLLAMPPRQVRRWTECEVDPNTRANVARIFDALWSLAPETDADGQQRPALVRWAKDGKASWVQFFNAHALEQQARGGDLAAAWSKLEGYCARLALVIHCCRLAAHDDTLDDPALVDAASVKAGAKLVRWFGYETERIYHRAGLATRVEEVCHR
jgi:hypothetical protein